MIKNCLQSLKSDDMILQISLNCKIYLKLKGDKFKVSHTLMIRCGRRQSATFHVAFLIHHNSTQIKFQWYYPRHESMQLI